VKAKAEYVQCNGLKKSIPLHPIVGRHDLHSVNSLRESPSVPDHSTSRNAVTAVIIFLAAHFALLVGVTTPEKFHFDEVHYVPAARQMLDPVMPAPRLNPMHPPLAKQLMALSIRTFGDVPLGWRYRSVLFGSLAITATYPRAGYYGSSRRSPSQTLRRCCRFRLGSWAHRRRTSTGR